jgi:DNA-binding HxlR family transcriptional regulator
MLAAPLNVAILRGLAGGPKQQANLRQVTDSPAQTTLRAQLKRLVDIGAVEKHRRNRFPGVLEYELASAGRDLIFVASVLERWLEEAPDGPLSLESNAAKAAIRGLAEGWSTTMLRALAARPLSLTELSGVIVSLSYPSLERRLATMRLAGLARARPSESRRTPYAVTGWVRHGVAPLAAAARWERRWLADATARIGPLDVETALLLAMPLVRPPAELSGSCRLGVEIGSGEKRRLSGAIVEVENDGTIASCTTNLKGRPHAWALGPPTAWLAAVIEGDTSGLELGGDCSLARGVVDGLHEALFLGRPSAASLT